MSVDWKQKLLAFLHDPPHKALDVAGHVEARQTFVRQAGFTDQEFDVWTQKWADQWAAAADRLPLLTSSLQSPFGGEDHPFKHPMGGSELHLKEFPSPDLLAGWLQATQPGQQASGISLDSLSGSERDRINFFLHWRRWPVEAAREPAGRSEARWRSMFQPADTRIPDHPIWLHNSVASALAGCGGEPAFLVFQLGPVQEFISQARSTRDLWSGSYLLSWLIAHAIKAVTDEVGPDAVMFPFLRAQPLFDLLHRDEIYAKIPMRDTTNDTLWDRLKKHENEMLVPNLPNKFLALVPASRGEELARRASQAIDAQLARIGAACWDWINHRHPMKPEWRDRFDGQLKAFPQVTWQVYAWPAEPPTEREIQELFGCGINDLVHGANPGLLWSRHYGRTDELHAARRNTRDFGRWMPQDVKRDGASKDVLSGKEEIVGDQDWWESLLKSQELQYLFRDGGCFGAINLVKRVWHKAYLEGQFGLKPDKAVRFESVPEVAAAGWLENLETLVLDSLKRSPDTFDRILRLCEKIQANAAAFNIRVCKEAPTEKNIDQWIRETAPEAFLASEWKLGDRRCEAVIRALHDSYEIPTIGKPPTYVAVIAFDGDNMGKWISGELCPRWREQLSKEAREKLAAVVGDRRRALSPSYHLQFSEALANFALYLVRPIVSRFHGQVMYAGGDDVLAMVPAAQAFECAAALRNAFRGQGALKDVYESLGTHGGFVKLTAPKGEQPTWPLIVPGPRADASAGIAIGHCHAPLQNLVEAARQAEKRAKKDVKAGGYGKSAFAVSLFKRSGEVLEWGARWDSKATELMGRIASLTEKGVLSGRFPYALTALLRPYAEDAWDAKAGTWKRWRIEAAGGFDPFKVFPLEFEHVARQQGKWPKGEEGERQRDEFVKAMADYLGGNGAAPELTCRGRRLDDFLGPFLTCAFISRGERDE